MAVVIVCFDENVEWRFLGVFSWRVSSAYPVLRNGLGEEADCHGNNEANDEEKQAKVEVMDVLDQTGPRVRFPTRDTGEHEELEDEPDHADQQTNRQSPESALRYMQ